MRNTARTTVLVVLTFLASVVLGVTAAMTAAMTMAATALIVPGTGTHNVLTAPVYRQNAIDYYISQSNGGVCTTANCTNAGVDYPATFWPFGFFPFSASWCPGLSCDTWDVSVGTGVSNLNTALLDTLNTTGTDPVVIFGYSQGAAVVSNEIRDLPANLTPEQLARVTGVVIGNIDRPNGGLFTRLGFLGHVPILNVTTGLPTPTDTIPVTDIAFQYDGVADFPEYPINFLADLNAILGFYYIHGTYLQPNENGSELPDGYSIPDLIAAVKDHANVQGTYNKTTYILIPTKNLPLLTPLRQYVPLIGGPLADLMQPVLKVLIDTGYDRTSSPGVYTPFQLVPIINPITLSVSLVGAALQGVGDFVKDITGALPLSSLTTLTPQTPQTQSLVAGPKVALTQTNSDNTPKALTVTPNSDLQLDNKVST